MPSATDPSRFGCTINAWDGSATPCPTCFPTQHPRPSDAATIGFGISAPTASATTASVHWSVPDPEVGVPGGGSDPCHAPDITQPLGYAQLTATVPMSELASTQPQTFTFSGGPLHWGTDFLNQPISLDYQSRHRITVQRVATDGGRVG